MLLKKLSKQKYKSLIFLKKLSNQEYKSLRKLIFLSVLRVVGIISLWYFLTIFVTIFIVYIVFGINHSTIAGAVGFLLVGPSIGQFLLKMLKHPAVKLPFTVPIDDLIRWGFLPSCNWVRKNFKKCPACGKKLSSGKLTSWQYEFKFFSPISFLGYCSSCGPITLNVKLFKKILKFEVLKKLDDENS